MAARQITGDSAVWYNIGNAHSHLKHYPEANAAYARAVEIFPAHAHYHNNWGWLFVFVVVVVVFVYLHFVVACRLRVSCPCTPYGV